MSTIENMIVTMGYFLFILKYKASIAIAIPIRNIIPNTISKNAIVFTISNSPIQIFAAFISSMVLSTSTGMPNVEWTVLVNPQVNIVNIGL